MSNCFLCVVCFKLLRKLCFLELRAWQEYVEPAASVYADAINNDYRPEFVELERGVLTETCGAPVVVVLTKTDEKPVLSAEDVSKLQYQVRKFCLAHGAALVRSFFAIPHHSE